MSIRSNAPSERRTSSPSSAGDTRARLLDAARRCVRDQGLPGATSREITSLAGANLAAITYHFGSKDELVAEALFDELRSRLDPALEQLASAEEPAAGMLATVQRLLAEFEQSRRDVPVYLEALVLACHGGPFAGPARKLVRSVQRLLRERVADLAAQGVVPTWVDPDAMASLIVAVANGVALQSALDPRGAPPSAMAAQFATLLLGVAEP